MYDNIVLQYLSFLYKSILCFKVKIGTFPFSYVPGIRVTLSERNNESVQIQ